jgi:hypothetical protein
MGCFNVAGTMSNLSIDSGDKVIFIPLVQNRYCEDGMMPIGAETMFVGDNGASIFYSPFCLPIVGEYNDYGSVENIVRDANVEYLEDYFGISIDQFMAQISRNWCEDSDIECKTPELTKKLKSLGGMFEDFDIYQKMITHYKIENSAFEKADLSSDTLEKLGLVLNSEKPTNDKRYTKYYNFEDTDRFAIYSDGTWIKTIDLETNNEIHHIYRVSSLEEKLLELGYKLKNTEQFKAVTAIEISLKKVLEDRNIMDLEIEEITAQMKIEENDLDRMSVLTSKLSILLFKKSMLFDKLYTLKNWVELSYTFDKMEVFLDPIVDLLSFNQMMYSTNNYFFPAMNGEQHGNQNASKALYEACLKITNDKLEEREY